MNWINFIYSHAVVREVLRYNGYVTYVYTQKAEKQNRITRKCSLRVLRIFTCLNLFMLASNFQFHTGTNKSPINRPTSLIPRVHVACLCQYTREVDVWMFTPNMAN